MEKMKKHRIAGAAAFLGILMLLLMGLSSVAGGFISRDAHFIPKRYEQYNAILAEEPESVDLVVFGDSLGYTAFNPMTLWKERGISAYNLAQPGETAQEAYKELTAVLRRQSPDFVIVETNMLYAHMSRTKKANDTLEGFMNDRVPLFRGHDFWKGFFLKEEIEEKWSNNGTFFKGYCRHSLRDPYEGGEYMQESDETEKIPPAAVSYLRAFAEECRRSGAEFILLSTPSPANHSFARHEAIENYARNEYIPYLDMNLRLDEIGIDWKKDSLDGGDHVNTWGALKVTSDLGRFIADRYAVTDRRGDPVCASWEEECRAFDETMPEQ